METKNQEIIAETLLNPEINLQFPKIHPSNPDQSLIGLRVELNDQIGIVKYVGDEVYRYFPRNRMGRSLPRKT